MFDLTTIQHLIRHNDWANDLLCQEARKLSDQQLDAPFDMGRGSFRSTLLHTLAGESVWLLRWRGTIETNWPNEDEKRPAGAIGEDFRRTASERTDFLRGCTNADLDRVLTYRDSKGSLFEARLGDMILQAIHHSIHHRAQLVNMLRRLGAAAPELDYMMRVRRPSPA